VRVRTRDTRGCLLFGRRSARALFFALCCITTRLPKLMILLLTVSGRSRVSFQEPAPLCPALRYWDPSRGIDSYELLLIEHVAQRSSDVSILWIGSRYDMYVRGSKIVKSKS
jgi:hypothetical protein